MCCPSCVIWQLESQIEKEENITVLTGLEKSPKSNPKNTKNMVGHMTENKNKTYPNFFLYIQV